MNWAVPVFTPSSVLTHHYITRHHSNHIIKFADDTTFVGLIFNNDEAAYREEVRQLELWCKDMLLIVTETKEIIIDFRRTQTPQSPLHISKTASSSWECSSLTISPGS